MSRKRLIGYASLQQRLLLTRAENVEGLAMRETETKVPTVTHSAREIRLANLTLRVTPIFDTYWVFAARRQALFMKRIMGGLPPWTEDPILQSFRFTNVYRASDRVSQFLIRHVLYEGPQNAEEIVFRCLLFKLFNRIETWSELQSHLGVITWKSFNIERYSRVLEGIAERGEPIYSGAYIIPAPHLGQLRKYQNHLRLLKMMMCDDLPRKIAKAKSLREAFILLRSYPSLGDFLAFQFTIDLNYSEVINFSEMDFVVAGPGAKSGIQKCFVNPDINRCSLIIGGMTEIANQEFERLGLSFQNLWGRPLQLIDCQNVFCEVDKYSRIAHPEWLGVSGRFRIKQRFRARATRPLQWYPPKWNLDFPSAIME